MTRVFNKLVRQFKADKKKSAFIVALVLVMVVMWGRLLLQQPPTAAVASSESKATSATAHPTVEPIESSLRPTVYLDVPRMVKRDLFALNPRLYPYLPGQSPQEQYEAKSNNQTPDVPVWDVNKIRSELNLEATLMGEQPRAIINGLVIRPGQKIKGFELKEIHERRVILEMNGIRIQLEM